MTFYHMMAPTTGGPEVLDWRPVDAQATPPDHVRIRVEAAGVLLADVLWQMGTVPLGPKPPFTPGYDVVGRVEEIGDEVDGFAVGQRVGALIQEGGYTQIASVPAARVVPVPEELEPVVAAAAITSYLTGLYLLRDEGRLNAGDTLLIHGAGGGTGSAIGELAHFYGIKVYGTASVAKCELVESKGIHHIDYRQEDFAAVISRLEPEGVDLVIDPIGGDVTSRSLGLLKRNGRLISTAMLSSLGSRGRWPAPLQFLRLPLWSLLHPGRRAYFWDVAAAVADDLPRYRQYLTEIFDLIAAGDLDPYIGLQLPLPEAAQAQQLLLDYQVTGKAVLIGREATRR